LKVNLKLIFVVLISVFGISHSFAQTLEDIEDIEENADVLFESSEYLKAGKLYLKVISDRERIKDHTLNFKYGACLLYNKGEKKQEAIAYLKRAVKNPSIDVRAYYYLGKAYHYNYQFDLAQKSYKKFQTLASTNEKKEFNVIADIKACENGKKLLSDITDMIVIKKTQIKKDNFYELYKLENIGGSILRYDEFQTKYDKKVGHIPLIHFPKSSPFIYFSSYGESGDTGLDIYVVKKLPNNKRSLAKKVLGNVNTLQDEDFPYMSPDGSFLYFSSKGHNSMGGYDVFKSKYVARDNSFMSPDNMDFAISSPDDDMFYIVDSLDRNAYFTSARESELGKLTVYHARVEKVPMQMVVIIGEFKNTVDNSNKDIEIVVSNYSNGKKIGTFKSNSKQGSYLINFTKSGKYNFVMTVYGEEISHQAVINIPHLKELRPLKMTITHLTDAVNGNYIKVEQKFDERFDNQTAIMAEIFKEFSKLKPNAAKFDLDSLNKVGKVNEIFVEVGLDPYSTKFDVQKVLDDKIIDLENIYYRNDNNLTVAYHLANEKLNGLNETLEEIKLLVNKANNETDEVNKNTIFQSVYFKNEKAIQQKNDASNYLELALAIDKENINLQGEIIKSKILLLKVKSVDDEDRAALGIVIYNETAFFDEHIKKRAKITKSERIITNGTRAINEISKINSELMKLNSNINRLRKENSNAKLNSESTKKKKLKDKYLKIISVNDNEIEMLTNEVKLNKTQIDNILDGSLNIELIKVAKEINDPVYSIKAYVTKVHPNDKVKIQNELNMSDSDFGKIDIVLKDNNIKAQKVSLTGLNEKRSDFTPTQWLRAIDKEIKAQENVLNKSTHQNEIDIELRTLNSYLSSKPINKKEIKKRIENLEKLKVSVLNKNTNFQEVINNSIELEVESEDIVNVETIINDFEIIQNEINSIENTNQKVVAQNKLNKKTINEIDSQVSVLELKFESDSTNEIILNQIQELEQFKENLSTKIDNTVVDLSIITTTVDVIDLLPNYYIEKEATDNSKASETVKLTRNITLNNQLISEIDTELGTLNAYLSSKPTNKKDIEKRIKNLEKFKVSVLNKNTDYQEVIDNSIDTELESDDIVNIETINNDFEIEQNKINSIENTNQKVVAQNKLNRETIKVIDSQISVLELKLESDSTNEVILNQIQELAQFKEKLSTKIDNTVVDLSMVTTTVDVIDLIPNYYIEKEITDNSKASETVNLTRNIALNNQLISEIDTELGTLNAYLSSKPTNKKDIEKRIKNLEKLKVSVMRENTKLQSIIDSEPKLLLGSISVGDLMPGFIEGLENIDSSNTTISDKAISKNKLNSDLINKIDLKTIELNKLKKENSSAIQEIDNQIEILSQLKSKTLNEIEINQEIIESNQILQASNQTKSSLVSDIDMDDFSTIEGKEKIQYLEDELIELNEINLDLIKLEAQRKNKNSVKSIKNISKKITKYKIKQAQVENEIIEELTNVTKKERSIKQTEALNLEINAKYSGLINEDLIKADKQLINSNLKIEKAKELRKDAKKSRNPIDANEKYKAAIVLEHEAKVEINEAIKTYKTVMVINELNSNTPIITSVDNNFENRQSTKLFSLVKEIELQANYYGNRAGFLSDSAETVKRKYKDAILIDVQVNDNKESELREKVLKIKEKAANLKAQEDELINVIPTNIVVTIEGEEKDEILESEVYKYYFEIKSSADRDMMKIKSLENKIKDLKLISKRKIKMAIVVTNDIDIKKLQAEIDALIKEQNTYKTRAIQKYNKVNKLLNNSGLSNEINENIIAFAITKEQPKEKGIESYNIVLADFKAPESLKQNIFRTTNVPIYKSIKDIPVNTVQPTGLIYKVQIGAFRNKPDREYFNKFAPVSGQLLDNGITRFMVGYFTNYTSANTVKTKIRGMGDYKDAFVVVYNNGKRISISKARTLELENVSPKIDFTEYEELIYSEGYEDFSKINKEANSDTKNIINEQVVQIVKDNNEIINVVPTSKSDKIKTSYYIDAPNVAKANQVEIMKGLFFTVQIGVYSKPVPSAVLFNITPLNSQLIPINKIRYTTGVFNSVAEASLRKIEVINSGIPDAFVTAYFNGERITVANAKKNLRVNKQSVLFLNESPPENSNTSSSIIDSSKNQTHSLLNKTIEENLINYNKDSLYYRIVIAEYKNVIPVEMVTVIIELDTDTYEEKTNDLGSVTYLSNLLDTYEIAKDRLNVYKEKGFIEARVIAIYNYNEISIDKAKAIKE